MEKGAAERGRQMAARPEGLACGHLLTFAVEEYFHADPFPSLLGERHARRMPSRLEAQADHLLGVLDAAGVKATFFVLGELIAAHGGVLRRMSEAGHELAARNWRPETLAQLGRAGLVRESCEVRLALEDLTGKAVRGFRIARGRFGASDAWALDALAESGFAYDSSVYPRWRELRRHPGRRFPFVQRNKETGASLLELPMSTWGPDGWLLPIAGGTSVRQLPGRSVDFAIRDWARRYGSPFNLYFHLWEFDAELPRLGVANRWTRLRRYRNLDRTEATLSRLLKAHRFGSVADFLGESEGRLQRAMGAVTEAREGAGSAGVPVVSAGTGPMDEALSLEPMTVVVPCFNEEDALPYTRAALDEVKQVLSPRRVRFLFVDDASRDGTWALLQREFVVRDDCSAVRHEDNRGVTAAILTGIAAAETELVGSMDCDCTYDPTGFEALVPRLTAEVALVTASPYHPEGRVKNVPGWRLGLSRGLSWMYRRLLRTKLFTYTSCFRVYRRSAMVGLPVKHGGFLGMAEMIVRLDERGARIVEHPAVLESRLLGSSKMKTVSTIRAHLGLLGSVLWGRIWRIRKSKRGVSAGLNAGTAVKSSA